MPFAVDDKIVTWGQHIPSEAPIHGPNERCIEIPLALEAMRLKESGLVLDAGCAMNGRLLCPEHPRASVMHLTQAIGSEKLSAVGKMPISYVSADLRDLSMFRAGAFDRTVCISTLEHVGLDNDAYHGAVEHSPRSVWKAVRELVRVTAEALLVTVPFAETPWRCDRWRYWGPEDVSRFTRIATRAGKFVETHYYAATDGGWCSGLSERDVGDPVVSIVAIRAT